MIERTLINLIDQVENQEKRIKKLEELVKELTRNVCSCDHEGICQICRIQLEI